MNRLAVNLGMSIGPAAGGFLATVSVPLLFIVDGARDRVVDMEIAPSSVPSPCGRLTALGGRKRRSKREEKRLARPHRR